MYEEKDGNFWHLLYTVKETGEKLELATTRPETMLGDTAVAVHPEDERYTHLVGKTLILPLVGREIPVIADDYVDMEFGTGVVKITMDLDQDVSKYHVVIVEDIIDTGRTLNDVSKMLKARNPLSIRVVTLLDKPERRLVDFKTDYALFTIPDFFVIGYGLDCAEFYRNLPYVAEYDAT